MNKKLPKLFALLAGTLMLAGCEESIPADKRYTPIVDNKPSLRSVLVEEYTGENCMNCPNGHVALEAIEELYNTPENLEQGVGVVAVGIHIPNWGRPVDKGGFITPEAESLTPEGVNPPQAQVNRTSGLLDRDSWAKTIKEVIAAPTRVTFVNSVLAEKQDDKMVISGAVHSIENFSDTRLHVWVVEDNIVSRQRQPDGSMVGDYVHMNVFRGCVNGVKGSEFALHRNSDRQFSFTYPISATWNPENLRVVVFVESPSFGVMNVTQNNLQINQ